MYIAAFIIAGFLIGFVVGTIYTLATTQPIIDAARAESDRWWRQAMQNLEMLISERNKTRENRDEDDANWWKK